MITPPDARTPADAVGPPPSRCADAVLRVVLAAFDLAGRVHRRVERWLTRGGWPT